MAALTTCTPASSAVKGLGGSSLAGTKLSLNPYRLSFRPTSYRTLYKPTNRNRYNYGSLTVFAIKEEEEQSTPSWAKPDSEEPPPWARNETQQASTSSTFELPFFVYLLASAITAIAAIGSVFEYVNQRPVFGVLNSDSIFYAPVLGFFAFTGVPTAAFLWFKSVEVANKEAEEQDRRDGYR